MTRDGLLGYDETKGGRGLKQIKIQRITPYCIQIGTDKGTWRWYGVEDSVIRCTYTQGEPAEETLLVRKDAGEVPLAVREYAEYVRIETSRLSAVWNKRTGAIRWEDLARGRLLLQERGHELTRCDVMRCELEGPEPVIERIRTVDGERNFVKNLREVPDHEAYRAKIYLEWQEGEALYGLGQGEEGFHTYRGKTQYLYQHNMRIPMPMLVSSLGYGILVDAGCLMTFQDQERGSYWYLDAVPQLDYYMIAPGDLHGVVQAYRRLTGHASMLPRWAFGYMQSKEAYKTGEELLDVAEEYRRRNLPISCVIQDWNSWEKGKWGNKHLDPARFGHMKEIHEKLHAMDVHTLISVWPNMAKDCEDYRQMQEAGHILPDRSTYDAFSEDARALYWKQAKEGLWDQGFDGWWCDSTEPFTGQDWNGPTLREPWERYSRVGGEQKRYLGAERASLFALAHARGIYENQRKTTEEKRVVNLTRSGYASQQQYGAILWSGDIAASWETLRRQIVEGLHMSMSGYPYWTTDIGAFFVVGDEGWQHRGCGGHTNPKPIWFWKGDFDEGTEDPAYRELYVRWLEWGTFLPIMRSHGTDFAREIWQFGEEGTPYYDAIARFIRLRYRLLPYIYSIAAGVSLRDENMIESLISAFPQDPTVKEIMDEYMFGPAFLVCPVTEPSGHAPKGRKPEGHWQRKVYLPQGTDWLDFWSGVRYTGGQWITADAPLEILPLFVRCGSIVPMADDEGMVHLKIFEGADGSFLLYQDSGDGYAYERGAYLQIPLEWKEETKELTIREAIGAGAAAWLPMTLCVDQEIITYKGTKISYMRRH